MKKITSRNGKLVLAAPFLAAAIGFAAGGKTVQAADADPAAFNERCATRLAIAFLGSTGDMTSINASAPQQSVDALLADPAFIERFARFTNSQFNDQPSTAFNDGRDEPAYFLSKYVLENAKPWSDLFLGQYNVDRRQVNQQNVVSVVDDPAGLGFFRSGSWMDRYAGNEDEGLRLTAAYRIQNNVVGLTLVASTNAPGADVSVTGRQAAGCRGCHYDGWQALDYVAGTLSKVQRNNNGDITGYDDTFPSAQTILGGQTISSDQELVTALVNSENYSYNACRLAFKYLYARSENQCEGPVFDKCVAAFKADGKIQSAIKAIATDATFCQ